MCDDLVAYLIDKPSKSRTATLVNKHIAYVRLLFELAIGTPRMNNAICWVRS